MNHGTGISVIMPAFNAEKTIAYAIISVLQQKYTHLELIVIDDCSSDNTVEIVKQFADNDERVRLVYNDVNRGVAYSRNRGVTEAKYDLIAFLDSDDSWTENKLEVQQDVLSVHPRCALCFTGTAYVNENGDMAEYILSVPEKVTYDDILKQNVVSCSSVLVKKSMMLSHPMPDDRKIHEDLAVWLSILKETPYAVGVNEPMLIYRVSAHGKSGNKIESAKMQLRTYRVCKVPIIKSLYCFAVYALRNIKKYRTLKKNV